MEGDLSPFIGLHPGTFYIILWYEQYYNININSWKHRIWESISAYLTICQYRNIKKKKKFQQNNKRIAFSNNHVHMCIELRRKNGNHDDICDSNPYLSHPNNEKHPLGLHASYHWELVWEVIVLFRYSYCWWLPHMPDFRFFMIATILLFVNFTD